MKLTFKTGSNFNLSKLTPTLSKMIEACRAMKNGAIVDAEELSGTIGISSNTVGQFQTKPALQPYSFVLKHKRWFANEATVREAKKQYDLK